MSLGATHGFRFAALVLLASVLGVRGLRKDAVVALEEPKVRPSSALKTDLVLTPYKKPKTHGGEDENIQPGRTDPGAQIGKSFGDWAEALGYPAAENDFEQMRDGDGKLVYASSRAEGDKAQEKAPTMNSHDLTAAYLYTRDWYQPMNAALRNPKGTVKVPYCDPEKDTLQKKCMRGADWIKPMNTVLEVGLRKLTPWNGRQMLYRGTSLPDFIVKELKAGYVFSDKGFMSTTINKTVASEGIEQPDGSRATVDYLLKIQCPSAAPDCLFDARDISEISKFPEEKEVLWAPDTAFTVDEVKKGQKPIAVTMHPGLA